MVTEVIQTHMGGETKLSCTVVPRHEHYLPAVEVGKPGPACLPYGYSSL